MLWLFFITWSPQSMRTVRQARLLQEGVEFNNVDFQMRVRTLLHCLHICLTMIIVHIWSSDQWSCMLIIIWGHIEVRVLKRAPRRCATDGLGGKETCKLQIINNKYKIINYKYEICKIRNVQTCNLQIISNKSKIINSKYEICKCKLQIINNKSKIINNK